MIPEVTDKIYHTATSELLLWPLGLELELRRKSDSIVAILANAMHCTTYTVISKIYQDNSHVKSCALWCVPVHNRGG